MSKKYHFIGIGGIGMGAIASIMVDKGIEVSGSDIKENATANSLKEKGVVVSIGHSRDNVKEADVIVYSSAIKEDNPELCEARDRGLEIIKRAEALAELMKGHINITVAGSHGKTTVTSMIANLLADAGLFPTTAVGGVVNALSSNAIVGKGNYFVAEVDESDGSFLKFSPQYSLITNIDSEHMDYYHSFENIIDTYSQFVQKTDPAGELIVCGDDAELQKVIKQSPCFCKTYGFSPDNDVVAVNISELGLTSVFECTLRGENVGRFTLHVPGRHNILNALACISLGLSLAIDVYTIQESIEAYSGVQRRFQVKYDSEVMIVDDYAHHPTEITATLQAARKVWEKKGLEERGRLIAIFQPHRFSRLKYLVDDFAESLCNCDELIITDVYSASEKPIDGVDSHWLIEKIKEKSDRNVVYYAKDDIVGILTGMIKKNDIVIVLGAGDITKLTDELVKFLRVEKSCNST